ncbi:HTTM domain-containing protein [Embleya sp. NBC_00888]|uniref:HTTM domain-containing protein n=1 Tax=Embleya sp. NBC_00888 TaxID=2975960 RepID=UPI00386E4B12|nr:HTTM domain-containing protein [Embleya sp. NBC_00888]
MTSADPTPRVAASPYRRVEDAVARRLVSALDTVSTRTFAVHQAALLRIGYGLVFLVGLIREYLNRREIWGDRSAWSPEMARELLSGIDGVSLLLESDTRWWFEGVYLAAIAVSALFVLGWHTRAMSVLFAVMVVSFNSRSILMTDGGDTVLLLMSIYLAFTACGRVWSLDARRARRTGIRPGTGPGHEVGVLVGLLAMVALGTTCRADSWTPEPEFSFAFVCQRIWIPGIAIVFGALWRLPRAAEQVRAGLVTVVHNCALFVIAAEVCFIYGAAGLYKVQGSYWQDGTAMHYVLNLEYFAPWPGLSHTLGENAQMGVLMGYLTVFIQVGFVFMLFAKRVKYVAIVILLGMHFGIAVLLGLPAFSASMSVGDALFLPTAFLIWTRSRVVGRLTDRLRRGPKGPAPTPAGREAAPASPVPGGLEGVASTSGRA